MVKVKILLSKMSRKEAPAEVEVETTTSIHPGRSTVHWFTDSHQP